MGWTCRSLLINCLFSGPAYTTKMDLPEPLLRTAQALQKQLLKTGVRVTVVKLWVIKSKQCAQWDLKDLKIILWPFLKHEWKKISSNLSFKISTQTLPESSSHSSTIVRHNMETILLTLKIIWKESQTENL